MRTPLLDDIARAQIACRLRDAELAASIGPHRRPGFQRGLARLVAVLPLRRSRAWPTRVRVGVGDPAYRA